MKNFGINMACQVILVAGRGDRLILGIVDVLAGYNIEPVICEDIYSATAVLAKNAHQRGNLIIGRVEKLSRDKRRFLEKISENENFCCCISQPDQVTATGSAHVFYVSKPSQTHQIIEKWTSENRSATMSRQDQRTNFDRTKFAATDAEIEALLGGIEQ